ncbi:hypothetical protein STEG23_019234 [Scotinomys teguina]
MVRWLTGEADDKQQFKKPYRDAHTVGKVNNKILQPLRCCTTRKAGVSPLAPDCFSLTTSSSSHCPTFLAINQSAHFIYRLTYSQLPKLLPSEQQDSATFKMLHHKKAYPFSLFRAYSSNSALISTYWSSNIFTFQEDENLWIASRLIWFDQLRPPDSSQTAPVKIGPSS